MRLAWKVVFFAVISVVIGCNVAVAKEALTLSTASVAAIDGISSDGSPGSGSLGSGSSVSGVVAAGAVHPAVTELSANPTRPTWTTGASSSDRGEMQSDFAFQWQSMGMGVRQWSLPSSIRYGLTSKVELRWGLPTHMAQSGGGTAPLKGISDQWLSALYRFHEQGPWMPALALMYAAKIPTANPSKGFGTGYTDHQLLLIASRDFGKVHFDFNVVGTIAGAPGGHDGATQFGLALALPVGSRFTWVLDSFGGAQPGTTDKYGAGLTGGTWTLKPWLVLDGAYTRAYTAGAPRQQFTFGITHAMKPGFGSAFSRARVARLFGR